MVKLGQIDQSTFEKLRTEITGGNLKDSHLVKGLDYALLKRVRQGEDVYSEDAQRVQQELDDTAKDDEPEIDVEEELDKLEEKEVKPISKEEVSKKGEMGPPPPIAGKKRTRDDILRDLKASRAAAAAATQQPAKPSEPELGPKFTKVGAKKEQSRIERDEKGREVLVMVDADGKVKRKVRKPKTAEDHARSGLLMPDTSLAPLGMDIPVTNTAPPLEEEEDGDIFQDVGKDYDPLADINDNLSSAGSDSSDEDMDKEEAEKDSSTLEPPTRKDETISEEPQPPQQTLRNYFNDPSTTTSDPTQTPSLTTNTIDNTTTNPLKDPTILAALKKAATIAPLLTSSLSPSPDDPSTASGEADLLARRRRQQMLDTRDRDAEDMDLEFGSSRFGDAEDADAEAQVGKKVRLSVWGAEDDAKEGKGKGGGGGEKKERKRGPKKGKKGGDGENAADVLRVMAMRKGGGGGGGGGEKGRGRSK